LSLNSFCQSVQKIDQSDLTDLFVRMESFSIDKFDDFMLRVFKVNNGSGSANISGTHEVSHNFYLLVNGYDEQPVGNLYNIGPFYNPRIEKPVKARDQAFLMVESGPYNHRKKTKVLLSFNEKKGMIKKPYRPAEWVKIVEYLKVK
jgi:hypothetical protein